MSQDIVKSSEQKAAKEPEESYVDKRIRELRERLLKEFENVKGQIKTAREQGRTPDPIEATLNLGRFDSGNDGDQIVLEILMRDLGISSENTQEVMRQWQDSSIFKFGTGRVVNTKFGDVMLEVSTVSPKTPAELNQPTQGDFSIILPPSFSSETVIEIASSSPRITA